MKIRVAIVHQMLIRFTLLLFCLNFFSASSAQTITQHLVEPTGAYKQIDLSAELVIIKRIAGSNAEQKAALMDSVQRSANNFTPSLLYIMSSVLFNDGEKQKAMYWFYIAQLRARYDVNRCADKTASAARYNTTIGPPINEYAVAHLDTLERIIADVVTYVKNNEENYDQRWINMEGMGVFTSSMGEKQEEKPLSLPKDQWPAIKAKSIQDYYDGFKEAIASLRAKQK